MLGEIRQRKPNTIQSHLGRESKQINQTTKKEFIETEQNGRYQRLRGWENGELLFKVLQSSVIR